MQDETTITIRVAPRFWFDHIDRETYPRGTEIRRTKTGVTVEFTLGALRNFVSDVDYYCDPMIAGEIAYDMGATGRSLVKSAYACRRALEKAGAYEIARTPEAKAAYDREWAEQRAEQEAYRAEREAAKRDLIEFVRTH